MEPNRLQALALVTHVATFVRILNASQTQEFHQWTLSALERAFSWAYVMESLAEKTTNEGDEALAALDAALVKHLQYAALPTAEHLTIVQLRNATRLVCDAVLTSAWLNTHPMRSELVAHVLKKRLDLIPSTDPTAQKKENTLSELLMEEIQSRRALHATMNMANHASGGVKRTRVQVDSVVFEIPSLLSYTLEPRTQRLQALAKTLQQNVCAAKAVTEVDVTIYADLLARLGAQLQHAQRDVVEVIVWSVVLDWPTSDASEVRTDVLCVVNQWVESQAMSTLLSLAPWPAAKLAQVSTVFTRLYLTGLLHSSLHTNDKEDLQFRMGSLVLQGSQIHDDVEHALAALDPILREELLTSLAI